MAEGRKQAVTDLTKRKPIRSKAIRDAANGEACACCGRNDQTTIFAHLNEGWAGKGLGQKADDFGMFLCQRCHSNYDGRNGVAAIPEMWEILRACYRTWRRLYELGIITIKV